MNPSIIGIIGLLFLFTLMAVGMPIGFAMAFAGFIGFILINGFDSAISMIGLVPYTTIASYIFSVLPLFLLMGEFSSSSGIMRDAYYAVYKLLGNLPGGLAIASIGGCAGFAAVCGSSVATAATSTRIMLPEMLKYKYDIGLATGCLAAGGTLGILIPPSLGFIIYGLIAEQSIGSLFIAGIFPGILLSLLFMLTIYTLAKINPSLAPAGTKVIWRERLLAIKGAWGLLIVFLLVIGGIWGGIFTPTEAAAVGAFCTFLLAIGRKRLTRQNLIASFAGSIRTSGMCFGILIGAMIFGYFMAVSRLPVVLADFVISLNIPPLGVLIVILLVFLVLGCLMDSLAMILITIPIFFPIVETLGFDPIWFGVIVTIMSELGLITPPIGVNVFVISGMVPDIPMHKIFRGILPFVIAMVICVILLIAFPQIAIFLPNTMMSMK